ncbi:MAG: hypothetical protein IPK80_00410 [Nannocystis sp.]|nr:hypothetical protein [Nannocystis sp.]
MSNRLLILFTLVTMGLAVSLAPTPLPLRPISGPEFVDLLSALFIISLVMERALEVFVNTWREPGSAALKLRYEQLKKRRRPPEPAEIEKIEEERQVYRTQTQVIALRVSFALGIVVSAVGIRTLEGLLLASAFAGVATSQLVAFRLVDILLTGGVIAGGSDAIHKVINVFTSFMDATAARTKALSAAPLVAQPPPSEAGGGELG